MDPIVGIGLPSDFRITGAMKGYKAFNNDLTCLNFQYEIGKEYEIEGELKLCENGFHFCENIADCYAYYPAEDSTRICEVEASGEIISNGMKKFCASKIKILSEVTDERKKCNINDSAGYLNVGSDNTGNCNVGNHNSGTSNTGNFNRGSSNTGAYNIGSCNSGTHNLGDSNTGSTNRGNRNAGYYNDGSYNTGDYNLGDYNSGWYNLSDNNSGIFNTEDHYIMVFDKESKWTMEDWEKSRACEVLSSIPIPKFITKEDYDSLSSDDQYKFVPVGFGAREIRANLYRRRQVWWEGLDDDSRNAVKSIPNFDAQKFYSCTGIAVDESVVTFIQVHDSDTEDFKQMTTKGECESDEDE